MIACMLDGGYHMWIPAAVGFVISAVSMLRGFIRGK